MKKPSSKAKKKLDRIIQLKQKLINWICLSEEDILDSLCNFEKTTRDEVSLWYKEELSDNDFANILLKISEKYDTSSKINIYITSSLGGMIERYGLQETEAIYNYFLKNYRRKDVSVYVSQFITKLQRFQFHPEKWDYIMSIMDMKPKNIAEATFDRIVSSNKNQLPSEYMNIISDFYKRKAEKSNTDEGRNYYLQLSSTFAKISL